MPGAVLYSPPAVSPSCQSGSWQSSSIFTSAFSTHFWWVWFPRKQNCCESGSPESRIWDEDQNARGFLEQLWGSTPVEGIWMKEGWTEGEARFFQRRGCGLRQDYSLYLRNAGELPGKNRQWYLTLECNRTYHGNWKQGKYVGTFIFLQTKYFQILSCFIGPLG